MAMTEELKRKMAEGRARYAAAIARGEKPPPGLTAQRNAKRRAAKAAAAVSAAPERHEEPMAPAPEEKVARDAKFDAAVEKALTDKLPAMLAALAHANGQTKGESPESFAKALALQMAKFTGQGTGKTYVDPEEIEKRARASMRMRELLGQFRAAGEVLVYRVIQPTQLPVGTLGPIIIEPLWRGPDRVQHDTEIEWPFVPNLAMLPLNESAKRVFALFETAIGAEMPEVSNPDELESPTAQIRPQLGPMALTPGGAVVRGAAAAAVIRNDPALRDVGMYAGPVGPQQAAVIRRGEDPAVRKRQVLGTLTDPIEMR